MKGIVKGGWFDFPDFYGQAFGYAKSYCKKHPEADRETVYMAASEAATHYEWSEKLRHYKFKNIVYLYIRNALYKLKRKNKEDNMDAELKQAIIRDYQSGMTVGEIAERHGLHPHTTLNNITNRAKKGLLELRASTPKPEDKPKHIKKEEKEPATAATATSSNENQPTVIISENEETVNTPDEIERNTERLAVNAAKEKKQIEHIVDFVEAASILMDCINEWLGSEIKITEIYSVQDKGFAEIAFRDVKGFEYRLSLRKHEGLR